ncbi:MAG: alpha/beta hydrolase-fold protein [Odoribacter sp.]|nr:alpha/beta hydrolase-fold protein [Odoribacter sp.]
MLRHILLILAAAASLLTTRGAVTDTLSITGKHLESPERVTVIIPQAAVNDTSARFPSIYLLNGYGGDHTSWTKIRPDMGDLADKYGFVIIMPDGRDSWYWDSRPGMEMESFFTEELVPYIDANLPTVNDRAKRAISGLSMGGHGAMWLAMRHSDIWGSAATMSGGVDITPFKTRWKIPALLGEKADDPAELKSMTAISLVPTIAPGQINLLVDCGIDDFFSDVNRDFHQALLDAKIPHDYIERPGAHTMGYWANSVLYHLVFFNEAFKK